MFLWQDKRKKRLALHLDKLNVAFFSFFAISCLKIFK